MSLSDYEETLRSYIYDDDKLVTYKWLSKELKIHVNLAKDILKQYWKKYNSEENFVATFLLIGQLKDKSIRVEVVKELDLNAAKTKFVKVDCEHLYSLQKSLQHVELLALAGEGDLRYSAIKCNKEYVRCDEEIKNLRYVKDSEINESKSCVSNLLPIANPEKQVPKEEFSLKEKPKNEIKKYSDSTEEKKIKDIENNCEVSSDIKTNVKEKKVSPINKLNNNSNSSNKLHKKPIQSKQSGFNNLFGKASSKSQILSKPKENYNDIQKERRLSNTLSKDAKVSNEKIKSVTKIDSKQEKEKEKIVIEKKIKDQQTEDKDKSISKSENKNNKCRGKKRNRKEENSISKRKRIVIADSSEDESNESDINEEESMQVEEEPPKISQKRLPSPPAEKRENGKRMIRKTIDKTFKDEDGYLVTKRIHVYEVADDNKESKEVIKEDLHRSNPVENKAKKQTSLMNFFNKS